MDDARKRQMTLGAFVLALLLAAMMAFIAVWDAIAIFMVGPEGTITAVIIGWSRESPLLPFFAGFVAGHLFFPARVP